MLGKIDTPLNKKLSNVKWGKIKLGDLFEIDNTLSFNTDKLVEGNEYDYVTRTSLNQGILQTTGYVNENNINQAGVWSLGLLQMDFFYRKKPWYAGQFVRKITPKFNLTDNSILFFTTLLNKLKQDLLSVLVRNVDNRFLNSKVSVPITTNGKIDFDFINSFIAELETERIKELETYLKVTGLDDYILNEAEQKALDGLSNIKFEAFNVTEVFDIKNTHNILSSEIVANSGDIPYLCASAENNSVDCYISYNENLLERGNCIFIGGKTFVVSYQEKDFFSNDSHNLILSVKNNLWKNKPTQLYLATCIRKSLSHKYSWGNSVSNRKIQKDIVFLPTINNKVDYDCMANLISAIQKLVIKDVVLYAERRIRAYNKVVDKDKHSYSLNKENIYAKRTETSALVADDMVKYKKQKRINSL